MINVRMTGYDTIEWSSSNDDYCAVLRQPNPMLQEAVNAASSALIEFVWDDDLSTDFLRLHIVGNNGWTYFDLNHIYWAANAKPDYDTIANIRSSYTISNSWIAIPTELVLPWDDCPSCGASESIDPNGVEPECFKCTYIDDFDTVEHDDPTLDPNDFDSEEFDWIDGNELDWTNKLPSVRPMVVTQVSNPECPLEVGQVLTRADYDLLKDHYYSGFLAKQE